MFNVILLTNPEMKEIIISNETEFYEKFLKEIIRSTSDGNRRDIIYRGHGDADWLLTPGIYRENTYCRKRKGEQNKPWEYYNYRVAGWDSDDKVLPTDSLQQAYVEKTLLYRFLKSLDDSGESFPELGIKRSLVNTYSYTKEAWRFIKDGESFPPNNLEDIAMIAQHYGIHTGMLDWSRNYLVALFFASYRKPATDLCVWAWNTQHHGKYGLERGIELEAIYKARCNAEEYLLDKIGVLSIINPPYHLCPNLKAQSGVFSFIRYNPRKGNVYEFDQAIYFSNLKKALKKRFTENNTRIDEDILSFDPLTKYIFKNNMIEFIDNYLATHNIHQGTIFPGFGGIANHAKTIHFSS